MIDLYLVGRGHAATELDRVSGVGVVQGARQHGAAVAVGPDGGGGEVAAQYVVAGVAAVVPVRVVVVIGPGRPEL